MPTGPALHADCQSVHVVGRQNLGTPAGTLEIWSFSFEAHNPRSKSAIRDDSLGDGNQI